MNKNVLSVQRNDIYFLEKVAEMIIVNNNYQGILVYNFKLEEIAHIDVFEDLIIYQAFKNENEYRILLDCSDNKSLVFVDLLSNEYKIISTEMYDELVFSPLYYWDNAGIYLSTYKGEICRIDLEKGSLCKAGFGNEINEYRILKTEIEKQGLCIRKLYSVEKQILVSRLEWDNEKCELWNYNGTLKKVTECILEDTYHDIEMNNHCVVKIGEKKVEILINSKKFELVPTCDFSYRKGKIMFRQGKLYIFLLCGSESNVLMDMLERYMFS